MKGNNNMKRFGMFIAKERVIVLIIAALLILPSLYGIAMTNINYDILTYLPAELDSMKGQDILNDVFHNASTGFLVIEDMEGKDVSAIKEKVSEVEGVEGVVWIDDLMDISVPKEILPGEIKEIFYHDDFTLLMVKFENPSSSDETQGAISEIRKVMNKQCFLSGTSALLKDTIELSDKETPIYVLLAVVLAVIVLSLTLSSTVIPFIFLTAIGMAILYNMGSNIFLGEISHLTKALAAVLQLGVTMDFSIFLMHRYEEELAQKKEKVEAMADAISKTMISISGSSLTTIAGFLALGVMELGIGRDIGFVMAKGVALGVVSTITVLPALILVFDKVIHRFRHKTILPDFVKTSKFITKHYKGFMLLFVIMLVPAFYGKVNAPVYYNLDQSLPADMESIVALNKLKDKFNMTTTHMILVNDGLPAYEKKEMIDRIEDLDGIQLVAGYDKYIGPAIPEDFIPDEIKDISKKGGYSLLLANSNYRAATDELNKQLDEMSGIVKSYDPDGIITGEGALTKDLIEIADVDFKNVSIVSIMAIFAIIMLVFYSLSVPLLLVASIEIAIFINMAIPFYTGNVIPFIASIVIGCIQLGATVDYAILLATRYREEIRNGFDKHEAMEIALQGSINSIVTSGLTFFAATIGVAVIADMDLISSLAMMISRGALISMVVIIVVLPALLMVSEKLIEKTTFHWKQKPMQKKKNNEKILQSE